MVFDRPVENQWLRAVRLLAAVEEGRKLVESAGGSSRTTDGFPARRPDPSNL